MATLQQMRAKKNNHSLLLAFATIVVSYFAYTKEDVYLLGLLGSLLYAAPAAFYVALVATRIRWVGTIWPLSKFIVIALIPLAFYGRLATSTPNADIEKNDLRIASYNVFYHSDDDIDRQIEMLEKLDADVLSLLEVNTAWEARLKDYTETYPYAYKTQEEQANNTVGTSMILSKYPIQKSVSHDNGYIGEHQINIADKIVNVVQLHAMPPLGENLMNRRNETLDIASGLTLEDHKIYLGNFNTVQWQKPVQKIMLEQGLRVASKGMATWPVPLPMAPIDHILTSFDLKPSGHGKICVKESDHCLIYVDIDFAETKAESYEDSE